MLWSLRLADSYSAVAAILKTVFTLKNALKVELGTWNIRTALEINSWNLLSEKLLGTIVNTDPTMRWTLDEKNVTTHFLHKPFNCLDEKTLKFSNRHKDLQHFSTLIQSS